MRLLDLAAVHPAPRTSPAPAPCPALAADDVAGLLAVAAPFSAPGPHATQRAQLLTTVRVQRWPSPAVAASAWVPRRFWPGHAPVLYLHRGLMGSAPGIIDAVVAHEVGHLVHRHRPSLLAAAFTWWGPRVLTALLVAGLAAPAVRIETLLLGPVLAVCGAALTCREASRARRQELEADDLAAALGRSAVLAQYLGSRMRPHPADTEATTARAVFTGSWRRLRHRWATHPHPRDRIERLRLAQ